MSEKTLYRKYRPQAFDEVVGQDHVVKVLKGAVKGKNISHAYLFSGSRGIGKTSIARIFAHAIGTTNNDIHEIDAASNRKIDDVREIRDAVSTLPLESEYKVYIIDEVHMLTTPAFNALLKTLEEPPSHALFILATTEADSLPETIISRCQTFQFKRPNQKVLQGVAEKVAREEGYEIEDSASALIALLADGSFRDVNGVLQKVISSVSGKKISVENVEDVSGAPRGEMVEQYIDAIATGETEKGLSALISVLDVNGDMRMFAQLVLQRVRFVLLLRFAPSEKERIAEQFSDEEFKRLQKWADDARDTINSQALDALLEAYDNMKYAYLPQIPLELALVKLVGLES